MEQQTIFIKGMVCRRCLMTVETELHQMGHTPVQVALGEVSFLTHEAPDTAVLEERLSGLGFSLLEDKKVKMVKQTKQLVAEVYNGDFDFPARFRFSEFVKQRLQKEYDTISDAFIASERKTIEQYIIEYRINKVKEFLVYSSFTLSDIAFRLNFTSIAHLSAQFKQQTGLTPSFFRDIKKQKAERAFSKN